MTARHPVGGGRSALRRICRRGDAKRAPSVRRTLLTLLLLVPAGGALFLLPRCSGQNALLLTVTASSLVDTLDVKVKDLDAKKMALEKVGEKVDPQNPNRDISQPGQGLKLGLEFEAPGHYLVYLLGQGPRGRQVFIRDFQVQGVNQAEAHLAPLTHDADGDGFPPCDDPQLCPGQPCPYYDCDDTNRDVNPLAQEICGNHKDEDCSAGCNAPAGDGDEPCVDADGDGEPSSTDCDDHDPCRSHLIKEASDLCNPDLVFTLPAACQKSLTPPFCGDGIDEDCSGQDAPCVIDEDCDGFSPPDDCDDHDPAIHLGALEICGDGKDNNCNGSIDEGCVPCDVDGDNHTTAGNTDPACAGMPHDDPDDYDRGINPGTTTAEPEGGTVRGALRGWCSSQVEKGGVPLEKDGRAPRDVDHNGDGKTPAQDGCPTVNCDVDGDGFPGAQCNPPASILDCDDNDPHTFPGAPDYCGDGKAQNCVADMSCACDKDRDHYCGAPDGLDCDDGDPAVYPWATEICNGKDDDCDGLIDEANPDLQGKPIPVSAKTCNFDNDGFCGNCKWKDQGSPLTSPADGCNPDSHLLSGLCVCSGSDPKGNPDAANRVACVGEDSPTAVHPRCIGARRAEITDRCDFGDYNCDGHDIQPGEDFAEKNTRNCSINQGECVMGKVTDCDLSSPYPYPALATANDKGFNPYWVCSGKLPVPEVCNGRDDDCDRVVPDDEKDADTDGYLPCSPPCTNLLPPAIGCGDCNDGNSSIHPDAAEICNGIDDNCSNQIDETQNDCSLAGLTCCPVVNTCKDLTTDFYHCGLCNNPCPGVVNNNCAGGVCHCGPGGSCEAGQSCDGTPGTCTCKAGACDGCCDNNHCRKGDAVGLCGTGGAACQNCDDGNECTDNQCVSGQCKNPPLASGTTFCTGGRCQNGQCCSGCWNGTSCPSGRTTTECGSGGIGCTPCVPNNECETVSCATGSCVHTPVPDRTGCTNGLCRNGSCCANLHCWDGSSCVNGTSNGSCGTGGQDCGTCTPGTCQTASCSTGSCQKTPSSTGSCTGSGGAAGTCLSGLCCTNCIASGSSCADGTLDAQCGMGGIGCIDCTSTGRTCVSQSCGCAGCWQSGNCYINDPSHCGTSCLTCSSGSVCRTPICTGGTCGTTNVTDLTSCGTECYCIGGSPCTTCYSGSPPSCNTSPSDSSCGPGVCHSCTGGKHCVSGRCQP